MDTHIQEFLNTRSHFLIICGDADEDSLSSGLLLSHVLKARGKDVRLVHHKEIDKRFAYIPHIEEIEVQDPVAIDYADVDAVITVDAGVLGKVMRMQDANSFRFPEHIESLRIDHHKGGEDYTTYTILDIDASSTSTVVYKNFISRTDYQLTPDDATLVAIGIVGDTGFMKWNTTTETFKIMAEVVEKGANVGYIATHYCFHKDPRVIPFLSYCLPKIEFYPDIHFSLLVLTEEDFDAMGIPREVVNGFVGGILHEYITRALEGYESGGVISEVNKTTVKGSFRGDYYLNKVDFIEVTRTITQTGGGHFNAAGFIVFDSDIQIVKQKILDKVRDLYASSC